MYAVSAGGKPVVGVSLVPRENGLSTFIGELADGDHDQVNQRPDADEPEHGHDGQDPCPDLSDVESVDAESAQEEAQQQGDHPVLLRSSGHGTLLVSITDLPIPSVVPKFRAVPLHVSYRPT